MNNTGIAPTRVLVVTPDVLGEKMAGPAIRALEIAKALSGTTDVFLASTVGSTLEGYGFPVEFADEERLKALVATHDVLVFQGHVLSSFPWIVESDIIIVADIYDPMQLEILEQGKELPAEERLMHTLNTVEVLNVQLERADFMICASDKQRDLWIGQLSALCRINPLTYDADQSLRSLIDVVPFGVQESDPVQRGTGIRNNVPGITEDDKVIIWGGGIYNWFDPLTLIHAVAELAKTRSNLRLFFLGLQHPNPNVPAMHMATAAMQLSDDLGLTDKHVFFNKEWVKYEERASYLLDADLGVSTHFEHVETAFSFRTRILDYLWAGLPIVCTEGDTFARLVQEHDLGLVVPTEDVTALAESLETVLYNDEAKAGFRKNVAGFRESMKWSRVLKPLVAFCESPAHAADYKAGIVSPREAHRRQLRKRIEDFETSTTWKLAAPLRWLTASAQRIKNAR